MKKKDNKLSIKWANFFIHGLIPLRILLNIIEYFKIYDSIEVWNNIIIMLLILNAGYIVLLVLTYFYAKDFTHVGYNLLYSLFITETIILSFSATNNLVVNSTVEYLLILLVLVVFTSLIWFLPNYIYFKKRKHLFVNKVT